MIKFLAVSFLIFHSTTLYSQVNIESLRKELDELGYSGAINVNLSIQTGSVDLQELSGNAQVNYSQPEYYFLLIGEESLGWKDGDRFSNAGLAHLRFVHRTTRVINPEIFVQANYSKERKLLERYLTGGGVRINLLKTKSQFFSIGVAMMVEYEKYDELNLVGENKTADDWRGSTYLSYAVDLKDDLRFSTVTYYQPRPDFFSDYRILNNSLLSFTLVDPVVINVSFILIYDSEPPAGIKNLDTRTRVGFGVRF